METSVVCAQRSAHNSCYNRRTPFEKVSDPDELGRHGGLRVEFRPKLTSTLRVRWRSATAREFTSLGHSITKDAAFTQRAT